MTTAKDLREALADKPELVDMVNRLIVNQTRLLQLLFDLGRLDDALMSRINLFAEINTDDLMIVTMRDNCAELLMTISSFIKTHTTPEPIQNVKVVYADLMKRIQSKQ